MVAQLVAPFSIPLITLDRIRPTVAHVATYFIGVFEVSWSLLRKPRVSLSNMTFTLYNQRLTYGCSTSRQRAT